VLPDSDSRDEQRKSEVGSGEGYVTSLLPVAGVCRSTTSAGALLSGENILCFALRQWQGAWKNNQQIMSRLSESNRILYIGPPAPLKEAARKMISGEPRRPILERISGNLAVYNEPRLLARSHMFPQANWATSRLRMMHVRWLGQRLLGDSPILWVFDPLAGPLLRRFKTKLFVYHMIDDYQAYFPASARRMRDFSAKWEERMLEEADVVFAVSEALHERALTLNRNSYLVPNGVDYELFQSALENPELPSDMRSIRRPIIGYVGFIQPTMDFDLLDGLAAEHPFWSFVLVGPTELGVHTEKFHSLLRRPNVHYLGPKPTSAVPSYVKSCDVCLMPDRERGGSDNLKLYEYLACGRPVVALDSPAVRRFDDLLEIARDKKEFAAAIDRSLGESRELSELRMRAARAHSWRNRVEAVGKPVRDRLAQTGGVIRPVFVQTSGVS